MPIGASERATIQQAADKHGIAPSILAGVYGTETGFGTDVKPSSAGALGPFQLEPGTARSLGVKDPNNFAEAANGAAAYLAQFKSRGLAGMLSAYNAGPAGGIQSDYVQKVVQNAKAWGTETASAALQGAGGGSQGVSTSSSPAAAGGPSAEQLSQVLAAVKQLSGPAASAASPARPEAYASPVLPEGARTPVALTPASSPVQKLLEQVIANPQAQPASVASTVTSGAGAAPVAASGLVNPVAGLVKGRTDQGVDFSGQPGTPIRTIGPAKVLAISPDWYAGQPYVSYELTGGPDKGKVVYVAEQIAPSVEAGDVLPAGGQLGVYAKTGTGIETGFGSRTPGRSLAQAETGQQGGAESAAGRAVRALREQAGVR